MLSAPILKLSKKKPLLSSKTSGSIIKISEIYKMELFDTKIPREEIDLIGFHGHTIYHNSHEHISWQIGDGQLMATRTKINVIADFRSKNIHYGFIAQELELVLPEVVLGNDERGGMLSVKYKDIIVMCIEAIKEQSNLINIKEKKLNKLELLAKEKGLI